MRSLIDWSSARDMNTRPSHTKLQCKLFNQGIYSGPFYTLFVFFSRHVALMHCVSKEKFWCGFWPTEMSW